MSACTCPKLGWIGRYRGSHLPGCPALEGRRGITDGEEGLLQHVMMWGSDGYPVHKLGLKWTWGTDLVPGPPVLFKTRREAVASFEAFHQILLDAGAGRI